ncbi:uncharacterized histidine-rich protein DDB_G0274557-like [Ostrinia nubilalis]|uniref:uncharacterized histidine-rich protein DDB_G0274557-like n=1 Tax=Ostrinia nubilalis TaxID=29057 RepID=UPI0030823F2C
MILKIAAIGLVTALVWLQGANGASYSKVYVQSGGPDVVPLEYYNYGAPPVISDPQIARLSAAPIGSIVPVQTVSNVIPPCVSPCVVSGPSIAPVAPVPSAKIVSYNSPQIPVVVAANKDHGYEYSYVVYDENTGDRKAQRELSDGAVVRGEYSFLQPDGYVREVQYTADDLTGFNVVVKSILPETVKKPEKGEQAPCPIVKHEDLKVNVSTDAPSHDDHGHEGHDHGPEGHDHGHEGHDHGPEGHDHGHEGHDHGPEGHDHGHEGHDHGPEGHDHGHEGHDHGPEGHDHVHVELVEVKEPTHEAVVVEHTEPEHEAVQEHELVHEPEPEQAHVEQIPITEHAPEPEHEHPHAPVPAVEQVEVHSEIPAVTHEAVVEVVDVPHQDPSPNVLVPYDEVLRCLQAKSQSQKGLSFSPLTYIILPASQRPC